MKNLVDAGGGLSIGRTLECFGGSAAREVRKDIAEGRKLAESPEGHSWRELRLRGYFVPSKGQKSFVVKLVLTHSLFDLNK